MVQRELSRGLQFERNYNELIINILNNGTHRETRNAKTQSLFGTSLVIDGLAQGYFPLLLGRKIYYKGVFGELKTMLEGPRDLQHFKDNGCNYWDKFADKDGKLVLDYGNAWIDFNGINQVEEVIKSLKEDPYGRRHVITGWRPDRLEELSLPCCHLLYQWYVNEKNELEMIWYQRSVDVMVGLPSDIVFAAAWNIQMAKKVGLLPGKITFMMGDTHIYSNHLSQALLYNYQYNKRQNKIYPKWYYELDTGLLKMGNYHPNDPISFELNV